MNRIWFHERRLQWWRVLRVSLLWGGLLMVLVLATDNRETERPPAAPVAVVPSAPASAFLARRGFVGLANAPIAAERARRLQPETPRTGTPGEVEVCGVGRVRPSPSDPGGHAALESHRSNVALAAWLDTVIQGGEERERAAALWMRARVAGDHATRDIDRIADSCGDNDACRKPHEELATAAADRSASPWLDRLAQMATRSTDPEVVAYAVQACGVLGGAGKRRGACQSISVEHWARVDENNVVPWLHVAQAARQRGDAAAATEALQRASQAEQLKHRGASLVRTLLSEEPRGLSQAQASLLLTDLIGIQAAMPLVHPGLLTSECSEAAIAQPQRREVCSRLAERMVRQPDMLVDMTAGARVGERLGWHRDRLVAIRVQAGTLSHAGLSPLNEPSCDSMAKVRRHWIQVGRVGERAAILDSVAASGLSLEEAARRNRQRLEAQMQKPAPAR